MSQEETSGQVARLGSSVQIANEVVGVIAGIAASEVEGVVSMGGGIVDGLTGILGKKSAARGVKVDIDNNTTVIDLQLVVEYGCRIPEVARKVQESVKRAVESMTGLDIADINIHVQGVSFKQERIEKKEEPRAK